MAFASGLTFAVGSLFVYRMKAVSITEQSLGFMMGAIISSLAIIGLGILWGLPELGSLPTTADLAALLPTLGWGGLLVLGLVFTVIWPQGVIPWTCEPIADGRDYCWCRNLNDLGRGSIGFTRTYRWSADYKCRVGRSFRQQTQQRIRRLNLPDRHRFGASEGPTVKMRFAP